MRYRLFAVVVVASVLSNSLKLTSGQSFDSKTRVVRGSLCYATFLPLISSIGDKARQLTQKCSSAAASKRYVIHRQGRPEVEAYVEQIQNSLSLCTSNSENLEYFRCLANIAKEDQKLLDMIENRASLLSKQYLDRMKQNNREERICVDQAVKEAQRRNDQAFIDLGECTRTGFWPFSNN